MTSIHMQCVLCWLLLCCRCSPVAHLHCVEGQVHAVNVVLAERGHAHLQAVGGGGGDRM
jgi:hypothetical protein